MDIKRILILAAHPDDGEFGAGGAISKFSGEGAEIHHAVFSPCIESLPDGCAPDTLFVELEKALKHLGISNGNIIKYEMPVRHFPEKRQQLLEYLNRLKEEIKPELVLMPSSFDIHQDHITLHREGLRAFRHSSILGYELPWNNLEFRHGLFIRLEEEHINAKVLSIQEYASQKNRYYADEEFIRSLAVVRGRQIKTDFAEGFEVVRWII